MFSPVKSPLFSEEQFGVVRERFCEVDSLRNRSAKIQEESSTESNASLAKCNQTKSVPKVFHRIRPLNENETPISSDAKTSSASGALLAKSKRFTFEREFSPESSNAHVYQAALAPSVPLVEKGGSVLLFAYGHTGTGKTHSTLGTNEEPGLYAHAAKDLQDRLVGGCLLAVGCLELHLDEVYDLVGTERTPCTLREDEFGTLHVRAKHVEKDGDSGKVYARGQKQTFCGAGEDILGPLRKAIDMRTVGSSSLHTQSSRSHCVICIEIVSDDLIKARQDLAEAEASLHPLGAAKDNAEMSLAPLYVFENNTLKPTCDEGRETVNEWIEQYETLMSNISASYNKFIPALEAVLEKKQKVKEVMDKGPSCLGGKLILCDLAGSDYDGRDLKHTTAVERKESRQINSDLLTLKQCFVGMAKHKRMPIRQSKLTRVLKESFESRLGTQAIMLCTTSPSAEMEKHTLSTLRYGQLMR